MNRVKFSQNSQDDDVLKKENSQNDQQEQDSDKKQRKDAEAKRKKLQDKLEQEEANKLTPIQIMIDKFLESIPITIIMTVATLWALFGDDIRVMVTNKYGDPYFYVIHIIVMILFVIEIVLASIAKPGYIFGFFFWLDVISTLSILLDIGWISRELFSGGNSGAASAAQLARAGRASRVGTKAGRIVRIIRLIRLVKLYKHAHNTLEKEAEQLDVIDNNNNNVEQIHPQQSIQEQPMGNEADMLNDDHQINNSQRLNPRIQPQLQQQQDSQNMNSANNIKSSSNRFEVQHLNSKASDDKRQDQAKEEIGEEQIEIKETQVGKRLSDLTTKRVITIVLSIMFSVPILDLDLYREENLTFDNGLYLINNLFTIVPKYLVSFCNIITMMLHKQLQKQHILYLQDKRYAIVKADLDINSNCCTFENPDYIHMRKEDELGYSIDVNGNTIGLAIADLSKDSELNALLSIIRTVFVSLVLTAAAIFFQKDVQDLVLTPLENMISKVKRIAQNPLEAVQIEEKEQLILERMDDKDKEEKNQERQLETVILEKLIIKIGALLALGFGEAGSEIIATNMAQSGSVNPMIAGKKILAIFGFCDIRNFTDATEVLQQEVMVFVNEIAEIVHATVDYFSGSANKNIGDAFLLVWKFRPQDQKMNESLQVELKNSTFTSQYADMSVLAFVKIITTITVSLKLSKVLEQIQYRYHQGLIERIKNYQVKMGFGLHQGWAIEGAIGSEFKVDASYLSPNVNMASRLEAATKQFGTQILISGILREICSDLCKKQLRHIDKVTVKGSRVPIDLYTIDLKLSELDSFKMTDKYTKSGDSKKKQKVLERMRRNQLYESIEKNTRTIGKLFKTDPEIAQVRKPFTFEFYDLWKKGFQSYLKGEWDQAKEILEKTESLITDHQDGPSSVLLRVIGELNQSEWKGYRELTEK